MAIVTMYVSVKAFVEQWYMWLLINVAYIAMWLMSDSVFSFMTVAKYSVYLINSFYGIYQWNKLSKEDPLPASVAVSLHKSKWNKLSKEDPLPASPRGGIWKVKIVIKTHLSANFRLFR